MPFQPFIAEGFGFPPIKALAWRYSVRLLGSPRSPGSGGGRGDAGPTFDADALAAGRGRVVRDYAHHTRVRERVPTRAAAFTWE